MRSRPANVEPLLDALPDALVGVDRAAVIQLVNRQTERLFGYEPDDLIGLPVEVLVPESVRPAHRVHREGYIAAQRTRGMGLDLPLIGRRRDGTQFPIDVALSYLDTEDALLVIAAVRDMTDRQKASQERDRTNRLLAVIEFSGEAIISIKLDGVITSWNPAAERTFGYKSQEIVGSHCQLLSPPERSEETATILAKIKAGQGVQNLETLAVRKDATVFPVCLTVSPIYDEDGVPIGASAMPRNLTRAQHGFESARSMIESSLDSLVAISAEDKITDVNETTVKATGVPRDQLIGTNFSRYFTDPEKADRINTLVFSKGMAVDYPLTIRRRDGTLTEVLCNASVHLDAGGKVPGVVAAARDVTKKVHAQGKITEQHAGEQARLAELERFQRMTIDRALKVIELKKEIETLKGSDNTEAGESDDQW
jgi:PAS domain S-box-containing protein